MDDVFCQIAKGEVKTKKVFENETILVIEDTNPKAKIHFLIFPKEHIADSPNQDIPAKVLSEIFKAARNVAKLKGVDKTGFRLVTNHESDAGQTIKHIHFHLLGGEKLKEI